MPHAEPGTEAGAQSIQLGWLGDTLGYNLRRAQNASFQTFSELTGDTGLRPGRYALLQLIGENPGISQTALSAAVGRDKSTLTPLLADLERRHLILREPDPVDKRGRRISLTKAGEDKLALLAECAVRHEARLNAIFAPDQQDVFLKLLKRMVAALESDLSNPPPPED